MTIEVLPADSARPAMKLERSPRQVIEGCRRDLEASPDSSQACNNLSWAYLTAPKALRDVNAALPLAEKAVRLAPATLLYRTTLGLAYYRAGRYREAVDLLRRNLDSQGDWTLAFDLYVLAMSHHSLGETARARDYYDFAVRWAQLQRGLQAPNQQELTAFRAEAEEVLGINRKKD